MLLLDFAAEKGFGKETVEPLLQFGHAGYTCVAQRLLCMAAEDKNNVLVELLIPHGNDTNSKDDNEQSPLNLGTKDGNKETVEGLTESNIQLRYVKSSFHAWL